MFLLPFAAAQAKEMIGPYPAVGYTTCGDIKVVTSTINTDDNMVLQFTDPQTGASGIYLSKRSEDHSSNVKYVLSDYDAASGTLTPNAAGTSVGFGISMGNPGAPGNDLYLLTLAGQSYSCKSYTVYNPLDKK